MTKQKRIPVKEEDPGKKAEVEAKARPTAVNELERYERQQRLWGQEGQTRIGEAVVTIVGSGNLARYAAMPIAALGIGQVRLLGDGVAGKQEMFLDVPIGGQEYVRGFERVLQLLNPTVNTIGIPMDLESRLALDYLSDSTVIVEATNDPRSKALAFEYARERNIPVITASVAESYAKMILCMPGDDLDVAHFMPNYEGHEQDPLISLFWGGLIADEVKKVVFGDDDEMLNTELYFDLGNPERFSYHRSENGAVMMDKSVYGNKSALVVGAGALGNIMAIALAELGFGRVDYMDFDDVESHNLNRQVLFYDSVGRKKATVLATKHRKMNPQARARGFPRKLDIVDGQFTLEGLRNEGYDIGLDLVDNLYTRALFSAFSVLHEMPLVSAATSPTGFHVATYVPGSTACLDHVFADYYQRALEEEKIRRISCIEQPDPSVIMTNQMAAAIASLEVAAVFDTARLGPPVNGTITYNAAEELRLGVVPIEQPCDCHANKGRVPDMEIRD